MHKSKVWFVCPPVCLSVCPSVCKPSVSQASRHVACRIKPSFGAPSLSYIAWLSVCPTLHGIRQRATARQSSDRAAINTVVHSCHLLWGGRNLCHTHPAYHAVVDLAAHVQRESFVSFHLQFVYVRFIIGKFWMLDAGESEQLQSSATQSWFKSMTVYYVMYVCYAALHNLGLSLWQCFIYVFSWCRDYRLSV